MDKTIIKYSDKVWNIKTDNFTCNTAILFFSLPLERDKAFANSLLARILKQGSMEYPSGLLLNRATQNLYGATLFSGVVKKGERHVIYFGVKVMKDVFSPVQNEKLSQKAIELLFDIILNPFITENKFDIDIVKNEKQSQINIMDNLKNNKRQYTISKCIEKMYENFPFGIPRLGFKENAAIWDETNMYTQYLSALKEANIRGYMCGEWEEDLLRNVSDKISSLGTEENDERKNTNNLTVSGSFHEKMDISQEWLSLGFETNILPSDDLSYPLAVFNGIFGGDMHSRLFMNVREKKGMAYDIGSRMHRSNGSIFTIAGISRENEEKVIEETYKELKDIKKGNINDFEFNASKKALQTSIRGIVDNQLSLADYYHSCEIFNKFISPRDLCEAIDKIEKDEVVEAANKVDFKYKYILSSGE